MPLKTGIPVPGRGGCQYLLLAFGSCQEMQDRADELRPTITERAEVRRLYDDQ